MSIKIKKAFRFSVYAILLLVTSLLGAIMNLSKRSNNETSSHPLLPSSIAHADVVSGPTDTRVDAESGACGACGGAACAGPGDAADAADAADSADGG